MTHLQRLHSLAGALNLFAADLRQGPALLDHAEHTAAISSIATAVVEMQEAVDMRAPKQLERFAALWRAATPDERRAIAEAVQGVTLPAPTQEEDAADGK